MMGAESNPRLQPETAKETSAVLEESPMLPEEAERLIREFFSKEENIEAMRKRIIKRGIHDEDMIRNIIGKTLETCIKIANKNPERILASLRDKGSVALFVFAVMNNVLMAERKKSAKQRKRERLLYETRTDEMAPPEPASTEPTPVEMAIRKEEKTSEEEEIFELQRLLEHFEKHGTPADRKGLAALILRAVPDVKIPYERIALIEMLRSNFHPSAVAKIMQDAKIPEPYVILVLQLFEYSPDQISLVLQSSGSDDVAVHIDKTILKKKEASLRQSCCRVRKKLRSELRRRFGKDFF